VNLINITTLTCSGEDSPEAALDTARGLIDESCLHSQSIDLFCLPEIFAWTSFPENHMQQAAEPIGGPVTSELSQMAARYSVNIAAGVLERVSNDIIHNSMVWFDRKGMVVGIYRKVFPTTPELSGGISPGDNEFSPFMTEFGPIGCCICFDINFQEVITRNMMEKPKLILFPTMFRGLSLMQVWSRLFGVYFLSAAA